MPICERLALLSREMEQAEIAARLSVTPSTVSMYISGQRTPDYRRRGAALATLLGVSLAEVREAIEAQAGKPITAPSAPVVAVDGLAELRARIEVLEAARARERQQLEVLAAKLAKALELTEGRAARPAGGQPKR